MTVMRIELKRWPCLLPLSQHMSAEYPSRDIVAAFFFSVIIHVSLALLLWKVAIDHIAVEPAASSIGMPLFVSLTTLPDSSREELEIKEVSVIPATDTPLKHSQTDPMPTRSVEHRPEAEIFETPNVQAIPASDSPEGYSLVTDTTPLFKLEERYRMDWDFEKIPEFKIDTFVTPIGDGVPGSESFGDKSLTTYLTPSYGLEAVNRFEQVFGEISEAELQIKRLEWRINYIEKYRASLPPDCRTAHANKGLLAIPYLIRDAITGNGCKW